MIVGESALAVGTFDEMIVEAVTAFRTGLELRLVTRSFRWRDDPNSRSGQVGTAYPTYLGTREIHHAAGATLSRRCDTFTAVNAVLSIAGVLPTACLAYSRPTHHLEVCN